MGLVILALLLAIPIFVIILNRILGPRLTQKFIADGAACGFHPPTDAQGQYTMPITQTPLLQRYGGYGVILVGNVMNYRAHLFDFAAGTRRHRVPQTVLTLQRPGLNLPAFEVRPRDVYDGPVNLLSNQGTYLTGNQQFDARYAVKMVEAYRMGEVFGPQLLQDLVALPAYGYKFEGAGDTVIVYRPFTRFTGSQMQQFINCAAFVASKLLQEAPAAAQLSHAFH